MSKLFSGKYTCAKERTIADCKKDPSIQSTLREWLGTTAAEY